MKHGASTTSLYRSNYYILKELRVGLYRLTLIKGKIRQAGYETGKKKKKIMLDDDELQNKDKTTEKLSTNLIRAK